MKRRYEQTAFKASKGGLNLKGIGEKGHGEGKEKEEGLGQGEGSGDASSNGRVEHGRKIHDPGGCL